MNRPQVIMAVLGGFTVLLLVFSLAASIIVDRGPASDSTQQDDTYDPVDGALDASLRATAEASPADPAAMASYASYLANTQRRDEAIPWFERAVALDPDNPDLRIAFGQALGAGGSSADAELQFTRAIALRPEDPEAHYYLAETYRTWQPQRTEDAIFHFQEAIRLGNGAYVAELAQQGLELMGVASPVASPVAIPAGSPVGSPVAS